MHFLNSKDKCHSLKSPIHFLLSWNAFEFYRTFLLEIQIIRIKANILLLLLRHGNSQPEKLHKLRLSLSTMRRLQRKEELFRTMNPLNKQLVRKDFFCASTPAITYIPVAKQIQPFASVWYEIRVLWPYIKPVKSHTTALGFRLQTDMNQIFQMRYCTFL